MNKELATLEPARKSALPQFGRGKRVLFIVNDPAFFLSHRLVYAKAIQRAGFEVVVVTPDEGRSEEIKQHGFRFESFHLNRWSLNPLRELRSLIDLVRILRKEKPDIVYHSTIKPVLHGSIAARITGVPVSIGILSGLGYVFVSRGLMVRVLRRLVCNLLRFGFKHPNFRLIVQNQDDAEFFVKYRFLERSKIKLVRGSGIDLALYPPKKQSNSRIPLIVMPARLIRDKGVEEFVQAARILDQEGIRAEFCIAGAAVPENPAGIPLSDIEDWRQSAHVRFVGHVEDMGELYADSQIVCLPSYREGLPLALIEAASSGRAIVTTDVPGCREVVQHGVNGLLVPPRDSRKLAEALRLLIDDPDLRAEMGDKGRSVIESGGFGTEDIMQSVITDLHFLSLRA